MLSTMRVSWLKESQTGKKNLALVRQLPEQRGMLARLMALKRTSGNPLNFLDSGLCQNGGTGKASISGAAPTDRYGTG